MKRDYITTFIAEALVLASALLVYRLVATEFGTVGFGEYSVTRRALTLLLPFGVVGLDVGIARLVAYAVESRPADARGYLIAALPISAAGLAVIAIALIALPSLFAQIFFGSSESTHLIATLPVLLVGATAHVLVYGNLRGRGWISQANLLMVVNHAVTPLVTLLFADLARILYALGLGWLAVSTVAFLLTEKRAHEVSRETRELFTFGIRRVPGDLVQLLFFALPVILAAQLGGVVQAGLVAFAITALGMIGSSLTPVGFVLLPMASRLFGRGSVQDLRLHVIDLLKIIGPLVLVGVVVLEIFADEIVRRYLGSEFAPASGVLRVVLLGALPWSAFVVLRSIVDARHERAVNARNLAIGFGVFVVLASIGTFLSRDVTATLAAFVLGLCVVGALTILESRRALADAPAAEPELEASGTA